MKRAYINLRYTSDKRTQLFIDGLKKHGYSIVFNPVAVPKTEQDLLISWNRIGDINVLAQQFQSLGGQVLIAENASWGNEFAGQNWYHIAREYHNTAYRFDNNGPERFNALKYEMQPWREEGETVVLLQRGIGSAPTVMPKTFAQRAQQWHPTARHRTHPGKGKGIPLEEDLAQASQVVTWGSGAAIKALTMGIKVKSYMPNWIGQQDNTTQSRLEMFQRLAWAQWRHQEIAAGYAFECLLLK